MPRRARMNEVRFNVRSTALLLREFTVADMVRATDLKPESVRTELQRMRQEGLLISEPHPDPPATRGGPPALYRLSDDPKARLELAQSLEAFYAPAEAPDRPTSRQYLLAQRLLDQAHQADVPKQRQRLLEQAARALEMAEQAEGGSLASENVRAYLAYEKARLAYGRNEREQADDAFRQLRGFFVGTYNELMVRRIDEYRLCLQALSHYTAMKGSGDFGDSHDWARTLLETLQTNDYRTESPLIALLLNLVRCLSQSTGEMIIAEAIAVGNKTGQTERNEIRGEINALRRELRELVRGKQERWTDDRMHLDFSQQERGYAFAPFDDNDIMHIVPERPPQRSR